MAATECTRLLPSLVEWGIATEDYPGHMVLHIGVGLYPDTNVYKSAPGIHLSLYMEPTQSKTFDHGNQSKICLQSLFKMLGYKHAGAVELHTIMMWQFLKSDYKV